MVPKRTVEENQWGKIYSIYKLPIILITNSENRSLSTKSRDSTSEYIFLEDTQITDI
jgi:hypothetical protein